MMQTDSLTSQTACTCSARLPLTGLIRKCCCCCSIATDTLFLFVFQEVLTFKPFHPSPSVSRSPSFLCRPRRSCVAFSPKFLGFGTSVAHESFPALMSCPSGSLPGTQCPVLPSWKSPSHASRASSSICLSRVSSSTPSCRQLA